jgi:hypothetical protein
MDPDLADKIERATGADAADADPGSDRAPNRKREIRASPRTIAIVIVLCFLVGAAIAVPAAHLFGGPTP